LIRGRKLTFWEFSSLPSLVPSLALSPLQIPIFISIRIASMQLQMASHSRDLDKVINHTLPTQPIISCNRPDKKAPV